MSLIGHGFLCIWHNIEKGREHDFERWHTQEHMPERLGIPGFNRGRRFANYDSKERTCFTLYEGRHVELFRSPGYIARLNAPTPWAREMQPLHADFVRGVCETIFSHGRGIGGTIVTARVNLAVGCDAAFIDNARIAAGRALSWDGVSGIHIGHCRPAFTENVQTRETDLRAGQAKKPEGGEHVFGAVFILEGIGRSQMEVHRRSLEDMAVAVGGASVQSEIYDLRYLLMPNG